MSELAKLTKEAQKVLKQYKKEFPEVQMDRDYFPLKLAEEWGECLQSYLMFTDRGRQKGNTKQQIHEKLEQELADVFGYLLLFAESEGVDLKKAIQKKWFALLKKK